MSSTAVSEWRKPVFHQVSDGLPGKDVFRSIVYEAEKTNNPLITRVAVMAYNDRQIGLSINFKKSFGKTAVDLGIHNLTKLNEEEDFIFTTDFEERKKLHAFLSRNCTFKDPLMFVNLKFYSCPCNYCRPTC